MNCLIHDPEELHFENFNTMTGDDLKEKSREELLRLEPKYGHQIYETFKKLLRESESYENSCHDNSTSTCCGVLH